MALDNNFIDEVFDEIQSQPPEPEPPPDWDPTTPMENRPSRSQYTSGENILSEALDGCRIIRCRIPRAEMGHSKPDT